MMLRHLILALVLLTNTSLAQNPGFHSSGFAFAQRAALDSSGFDSSYKLTFRNAVQDKNFYLLSLFQRDPEVRRLLSENKVLKKLSDDKLHALRTAANCNDVSCFDQLFRLSGPDIEAAANELGTLAQRPEFKKLSIDMRRSGAFIKYNRQSDPEMFVAAWIDAAHGMNRLLRDYWLGQDAPYKDIYKVRLGSSSDAYRKLLKVKTAEIKPSKAPLFFEPSINFALKLLE